MLDQIQGKKDEIAQVIQKYLEKQPLIILGTGATIPHTMPSMDDLANHIKVSINDKSSEWKYFLSELSKTKNLELALHNVQLNNSLIEQIIFQTWNLVNENDLRVYKYILSKMHLHSFDLNRLFAKLLQSHPKHVQVVTTNYDRIAEYSADLAGANVYTGFTGKYIQYFAHTDPKFIPNDNRIDIWKVHGSLDWFLKKEANIIYSTPLAKEIPDNSIPRVVTPGIYKYQETHHEPYRTVISKADEAIINATCFLCVGYGFNDEHIQPKLVQQVQQKNKPIVSVTKKLSDKGKSLLLDNSVKAMVLEEEDSDSSNTKVTYFYDGNQQIEFLKGDYWKLDRFLTIWF